MNRRELIQAMLAAPLVPLIPSVLRTDAIHYSDPLRGKFLWFGGLTETCVQEQGIPTYTYDTSVAIGICEGPVQGIRRIWADGLSPMGRAAQVEIEGAAICIYDKRPRQLTETDAEYFHRQAFTAEIEKRLTVYLGTETQAPSPLIEAHEGAGNAPTFRGLHYATLQDLPVEPFGNRVPDFWFETAYQTANFAAG